jgi:hypothetical protein
MSTVKVIKFLRVFLGIDMDNQNKSEHVVRILNEFMSRMKVWETKFFHERKKKLLAGIDDEGIKVEYGRYLREILVEFALEDKTNFGRLIDLGCTNPPTYDPDGDIVEVLSEKDDLVVLSIQQTSGAEVLSRVTFVYKLGAWRIKMKESLGYNDKWKRSPL